MIAHNLVMADIEHSMHTKHGDSRGTYRAEGRDVKMAGKTQGTGSAGCLWSIKSHTILRTHQELHGRINLPCVNITRCIKENNEVFIDDADAKAAIQNSNFYSIEHKTVAHL